MLLIKNDADFVEEIGFGQNDNNQLSLEYKNR